MQRRRVKSHRTGRRRSVVGAAIVLAVTLTTACHDPTDVAQFVYVRVEGTPFELSIEGSVMVPFTVVNPGDDTVWVAQCGGVGNPVIDQWQDDKWVVHSSGICLANDLTPPSALAPGAHYDGDVEFHQPGRFRLRIGAGPSASSQTNWNAASNAFEVKGPTG